MHFAFLLLAALLPGVAPRAAFAQPRPFTCVGAEHLEEDVFAIPFARSAAVPGDAARTNLAAAATRAKQEPERMLCVLGHAGPLEGGAQTGLQLAARRAGEVATALAKLGVARDRVRAEARRAAYARGTLPEERSVTVVLLPVGVRPPDSVGPAPAPARGRAAEPGAARPAAPPSEAPREAPLPKPPAIPVEAPKRATPAAPLPVPPPAPEPPEAARPATATPAQPTETATPTPPTEGAAEPAKP